MTLRSPTLRERSRRWLLTCLSAAALLLPAALPAATFTVNNTGSQDDADALAPGGNDGVCDIDLNTAGLQCTIRAAIQEANDTAASDTILFASSITSITLTTGLPTITTPMIVDGNNASAVGSRVNINGGGTNSAFDFGPNAQGSTIKNLVIRNFNDDGIAVAGHGYTIENNYIGVLPTGLSASANSGDGINVVGIAGPPANIPSLGLPSSLTNIATITADLIAAFSSIPPNRIRNNVISGNAGSGIEVFSENAAVNIISNNIIGASASGLTAIPNGSAGGTHHGVFINSFAYANVVGPGNLISGNTVDPGSHGVCLCSGAVRYPNFVSGNIIGPSSAIITGLGNAGDGVYVDTFPQRTTAPLNNTGLAGLVGPGNVIGYNGTAAQILGADLENQEDAGIDINGASAKIRVLGNFIGVGEDPEVAGSFANLGNNGDGIIVTTADHIIGGNAAPFANVISHNKRHGISVRTSNIHSLSIQGNIIGRNPLDQGFLPNTFDGIRIFQSSGVSIGGSASGEGNTIAGNGRHGIKLGSSSSGAFNLIAGNRIWGNADLGIDLDRIVNDPDPIPDPLGLDPNLVYANFGQNQPQVCDGNNIPGCAFPTYNSGTGATSFSWRLESAPNTPYTIEVFANDSPDSSGSGEGQYFLGRFTTTTNASGQAAGSQSITPASPLDTRSRWLSLTARATNTVDPPGPLVSGPANHTSEFSNAAKVPSPGTLQFTLANYTIGEAGGNATIIVSRTNGSDGAVGVTHATTNGTALQPSDYGNAGGQLFWAAGDTASKSFNVPIVSDTLDENDETVTLTLSDPTGGAVLGATATATLTITDDDNPPTLSIDDVAFAEGSAGTTTPFTFTVSLSAVSSKTISVTAASANGIATLANNDYQQLLPTVLTFNPGQAVRTVTVTVNGDDTVESTETFFVNLSAASNATLDDAQGVGTIIADEVATVSIADAAQVEGNSGTSALQFLVTRSNGSGSASVTVTSSNAGATAGQDYVMLPATTVSFANGETSKPVNVTINGDLTFEDSEEFTLTLSNPSGVALGDASATGTIINDDAVPQLGIQDLSQNEGNVGSSNFSFTLVLSNPSEQTITVSASTADQTATVAGNDYQNLTPTTVTFNPGQTTRPQIVVVNGDPTPEPNETFRVMLSNAVNATLVDNQAVGTIVNDDAGGDQVFKNGFE